MATSEEEYEPQYPTDSDEIYVLEHYDDQPQSSLSSSSSLLQLFDNLDGVEEEDEREPQLGEDYDQDDDNEMLLEGFGDTDDLVFGFNYDITLLHDDNEYYITSFKDSPEEILHDIDAPCHDDDEKDISFGDNKETSFGCGRQRSKIDDDDDVDDVNDEKGTIAGKTRKTLFKKRKFSAVCDDNDEDVDHDADADDDDGDKKDVTLQEKKQGLYRRSKITVVRDFPFGCGRPMTKTSDDDDVGHDVDVNFDDDDDGDGDGDDKDVTRQENKQGMYKRRKITVVRDFPFGCGRSMTKTSDDHDVDHDDDLSKKIVQKKRVKEEELFWLWQLLRFVRGGTPMAVLRREDFAFITLTEGIIQSWIS
ncbi:uncharacterized protein LOC125497961 [Beta vulgaris subsp. vulgaris]|uniref:uncharacterized protein LOC125497961 n=1 Tax=Beta vulgaris subsp. vulgaris TaxID=3555 RepID=UPI0020372FEE|nr:uncharacterized protein LOC125497961 [Beta vulgaris subsp. vulgaris]